ncbi:DUF4097 domain-containing protein [Brevibacillus sp. GCM10020057]|uniref:DUF4097 family beta strand repeat-containing protein n=1 Tax=Brevibacillus sp. GCM10020057 TaxID=3317327 RepID=UPI0036421BC3
MRNWGKKLFGLCLLLFVVGAAGLVWLLAKQEQFTFSLRAVNEERIVSRSISALELSTDTTDVLIGKSNQSNAIVRLVGEAPNEERERISFSSDVGTDGTLRVHVRKQPRFSLFFMGHGHLQVQVLLPDAVYEKIILDTTTGDIRSEAIFAKQASITSSTGDIDLAGFHGGQLSIQTDTGDMKLIDVDSALTVTSSTGDVNNVLTELARDVEIRTDTGNVRISTAQKPAAASLELESDSGDVQVDWPQLTYERKEEHHVQASVGTGGSKLFVKTATGDIRIQ